MTTTLHMNGRTASVDALTTGDGLWLMLDALPQATGWELKPEGACLDDVCVPIPAADEARFVRDGRFNVLALAGLLGQPAVHDAEADAWLIDEHAAASSGLTSLEAPDFELPDLDGRSHRLSDYRGRKVLLATWASW